MIFETIQHQHLSFYKYSQNNKPIGVIVFIFYSEYNNPFEYTIDRFLKQNYICYTWNINNVTQPYIISLECLLQYIRLEFLDIPIFSYSFHICNIIIADFLISGNIREIHSCIFENTHISFKTLTKMQFLFYKSLSLSIPSYRISKPFPHSDITNISIFSFFYFISKTPILQKINLIHTPILSVDEKNNRTELQNSIEIWIKNKIKQKE
ncbi:MAG: hypothetical protein QM536_03765 [Chitinophagaceae bacterium]|nr:hypothetical protein [Chitinophagaceae bacterium]